MTSGLHDERLEAALAAVRACGAASVLDLGCGDGDLVMRLAGEPQIGRILGLDIDRAALERLRGRLGRLEAGARARARIAFGSMLDAGGAPQGFDCATLIETIEHLAPADLPRLEHAVFARMRPRCVVVTTPNAEFNRLLGVPPHRFRHPGHRFEWDRARFAGWAGGIAARHGYAVVTSAIAGCHPDLGGASQMAVFTAAAPATSHSAPSRTGRDSSSPAAIGPSRRC